MAVEEKHGWAWKTAEVAAVVALAALVIVMAGLVLKPSSTAHAVATLGQSSGARQPTSSSTDPGHSGRLGVPLHRAPTTTTIPTRAPGFTSGTTVAVRAGTPVAFKVTTTGFPTPTITESGTLPAGLHFRALGRGTATIAGTAPQGTAGVRAVTLDAANSAGTVTQTLTFTVTTAPVFSAPAAATSIVGLAFSFPVTVSAAPTATITETGALPPGIHFTPGPAGGARFGGTATSGSAGTYHMTLTALNSLGSATQSFTLLVAQAPSITSPSTATLAADRASVYGVTTTGYPAAVITATGRLPAGLTFVDHRNGTASLAGTPATAAVGVYTIDITADNPPAHSVARLTVTLSVVRPVAAVITVPAESGFFTVGQSGAVALSATGSPTPTMGEIGPLPRGLTLVDRGSGTALLSGTPSTTGTFQITITASNSTNTATLLYTVYVGRAPVVTSPATVTATASVPFTFALTATGYFSPIMSLSGTLPDGLNFDNYDNQSPDIYGTPTANSAGTYVLTVGAANAAGTASQTLTLVVAPPPP